ncbi:MAG TPA: PEGA domain-containing protein [Candidatus Saccharimonadales bacterium]|nr:PEGA domain-containing protein [Candidatus Saccharimonadales bacterium]
MDFLDPRKQKAHARRLIVGYFLIGIAILLTTTILLYRAYGYELGKNGQIIQQGLVFVSSQPNPATIYIDGKANGNTNKRIFLQAGQYTFRLARAGYRPWVRAVSVEGGSVEHFDYPFLFPTSLTSSSIRDYATQPSLVLQSPSRQYLLVASPNNFGQFDEFDLGQSTPAKVTASQTTLTIPSNVLSSSTGPQSWQLDEWSTDNAHVILQHFFEESGQSVSEYILLNRQDPTQSVNLTNTFGTNPTKLEFIDSSDYTNYYIYDQSSNTLDTATLNTPVPKTYLSDIMGFKPYSSGTLLYATTQNAPSGKVNVELQQGSTTYPIRQLAIPSGGQYLLDFTQYSGHWYIVAGTTVGSNVYVYRDPQVELQAEPAQTLAPISILKVADPSQVAFSASAQFIMGENGSMFSVYDAQNDKNYTYQKNTTPLDAPQQFATWMDGDRITYTSGGKLVVFDYDSANQQTLMPTIPGELPFFSSNYHYVYDFNSVPANGSSPAQIALNATALLAPADL